MVSLPLPPVMVSAASVPVMFTAVSTELASTTSMPVMLVAPRSTLVPVTVLASFRVSVPAPPVTVSVP